MCKIELSSETIKTINTFLDTDELDVDIRLMDDAMDEYLELNGENLDAEEAKHRLDMAASLRRVSKNFQKLLNAINNGTEQ